MAKRTLQQQGVPIPAKLSGPQVRGNSGKRFKESGGPPAPSPRPQSQIARRNSQSSGSSSGGGSLRLPASGGGSSTGASVGALEAEFLGAILLLILLLFANNSVSYTDRMMSFIKRGALTCLLFFILALTAGIGPRANKVAVAFGALIIVAILVTAPVGTMVSDVDMLIKNDWVGQPDLGPNGPGDANSGTQGTTGGSTPVTLTQSALEKLIKAGAGTPAYNAATAEIRAFKSGEVWKVPADAVTALEDIGTHTVSGAWDKLQSVLHWFHL